MNDVDPAPDATTPAGEWSVVPDEPSIARAPLPTPKTLRQRQNLLVQAWRFVALNARMAMLAMRGHG